MKSDSNSKRYRIKRTLKRDPSFHVLTDDDIKYLWADLKKGKKIEISPQDFINEFSDHVSRNYDYAWTLTLDKPMGMVFGQISGPMIMLGDMHWFEWATNRNKIECSIKLLNELRKTNVITMYSTFDDKKFYEHIAKHGILRRVGTLYGIYEDEPATFFQTRV